MKKIVLMFMTIVFFCSGAFAAEMKEYVVKNKDNAGNIAYKLGISRSVLVDCNPNVSLEDIGVGQVLYYRSKSDDLASIKHSLEKLAAKPVAKEVDQARLESVVTGSDANVVNALSKRIDDKSAKLLETVLEQKSSAHNYVVLGIFALLIMAILIAWLIRMQMTKVQAEELTVLLTKNIGPQWTKPFEVNGKSYQYLAVPDDKGKFPSLILDNKGGRKTIADLKSLRRSITSSFRKETGLIEIYIKNGRLREAEQTGGGK